MVKERMNHSSRKKLVLNWKIPLWFAGIGVAICAASFTYALLVDWNVHLYNPTFENAVFYLCPATILQIATADAPVQDAANQCLIYELWVVAAVVNALLYGVIGLVIAVLLRIRSTAKMQKKIGLWVGPHAARTRSTAKRRPIAFKIAERLRSSGFPASDNVR
jgi:hypothetical protein